MRRRAFLKKALACGLALPVVGASRARGEELEPKYKAAVDKGLEWVVKQQNRDGHWEGFNGQHPMAMTGMAGVALLMEGSTLREGKYAQNIRKAVDWFMVRAQPNGLLGNPNQPGEMGRYMYGHGFGLLFLACVYGEEEDGDRRKKLEEILTRAVKYSGDAQTNRGGWGYVSARENSNFDEGSVTITQLQGIRASRNAGIVVPKEIIDKAVKYLEQCTDGNGGIIYSLASGGGGGRPALTAAAIACGFSAGEYNSPFVKKWLKFCQQHIPILAGGGGRFGHDEYTHYYYAQSMYALGENGWDRIFPGEKGDKLTWSKYRKAAFDNLVASQQADGSWTGGQWSGGVGPIYVTSAHLTIMQLDNATLPIYQR